jgi:hypothetical protein
MIRLYMELYSLRMRNSICQKMTSRFLFAAQSRIGSQVCSLCHNVFFIEHADNGFWLATYLTVLTRTSVLCNIPNTRQYTFELEV